MKLLLTSAGFTNGTIADALLDLTQSPFNKLNLVFIPTAANVEEGDKGWLIDDYANCKKLGFSSIDIVDISALLKDIWKSRLEQANILMFGGGNTFHLADWLEKSGLRQLLPELLKTKVYVGISAGSMVTSKNLFFSQLKWQYYEGVEKLDKEGLGFVNFQIRPHFNSPSFPKVRTKYLEKLAKKIPEPIYAIDDKTAIKVLDREVLVVSEGEWKRFN